MKFGQVNHPEDINFALPDTPASTIDLLHKYKDAQQPFRAYVGMPRWNRKDLKGLYPKGTKDDLLQYSTQLNAIEFNGTFYKSPAKSQVEIWRNRTADDFCFCPKISQSISHYSRLQNCQEKVLAFVDSIAHFEDKLGPCFLQLHDNYKPKDFDRLAAFLTAFPKGIPLALEVRNEAWFSNKEVYQQLLSILANHSISNIIVDTPGRRDVLHQQLTTPTAFVRFVSSNHASDYERLDEWIQTIAIWKKAGLQQLYFFIHQNLESQPPVLVRYFIEKLNPILDVKLSIPFTKN